MTNLTTIFDIYEHHRQEDILHRLVETKVYLNEGAKAFASKVRPIDTEESQEFVSKLEKVFTSMSSAGNQQYLLSCGRNSFSLDYLLSNFDPTTVKSYANDIKLLLTTLRMILNEQNIHQYQRLAEFYDFLCAVFESMGRDKKSVME
ncbi:hypothetical protein GCM10027284_08920 [Cyclobacterium sediminis]